MRIYFVLFVLFTSLTSPVTLGNPFYECLGTLGTISYSKTACQSPNNPEFDNRLIAEGRKAENNFSALSDNEVLSLMLKERVKAFNDLPVAARASLSYLVLSENLKDIWEVWETIKLFKGVELEVLQLQGRSESQVLMQHYMNELAQSAIAKKIIKNCKTQGIDANNIVANTLYKEMANQITAIPPENFKFFFIGALLNTKHRVQQIQEGTLPAHSYEYKVTGLGRCLAIKPRQAPSKVQETSAGSKNRNEVVDCTDEYFKSTPYSVRWANDNTDPTCRAAVRKIRELGNQRDFNCNKLVRQKWQMAIENASRLGCNL